MDFLEIFVTVTPLPVFALPPVASIVVVERSDIGRISIDDLSNRIMFRLPSLAARGRRFMVVLLRGILVTLTGAIFDGLVDVVRKTDDRVVFEFLLFVSSIFGNLLIR